MHLCSTKREAMQCPNTNTSASIKSFKQAFLKNLLLSLQACTSTTTSFNAMSLHERKRAVKSSADVAMAAARGAGAGAGGARWPKAILAASTSSSSTACKVQRCKRIVRRCCHKRRSCTTTGSSTSDVIARRLVRRRTMALRKVIPGGDAMDEVSLLHEAMDYVVHLRAQVDVLSRVSIAVQRSSVLRDSWSQCALQEKEASSMREW